MLHKSQNGKRRPKLGFSLVEVVMAIGLLSFTIIPTFSLIVIGLNSSRESVADTLIGLVIQDARTRMAGDPLQVTGAQPHLFYYDYTGAPLAAATDPKAYFEVKVTLVKPTGSSGSLLATMIEARWPMQGGTLVNEPKSARATSFMTTLTPPQWKSFDNTFVEKIEY